MSGVVRWADPPEPRTSRTHTQVVLEQLQSRPGEWAVVAVVKNNGHHVKAWQSRGCESVSRKTSLGNVEIYARWPAPTEPPEPEPAPDLEPATAPGRDEPVPPAARTLGGYMAARRARGIDR